MIKLLLSILLALTMANSDKLKSPSGCVLSQDGKMFLDFKANKIPSNKVISGEFTKVEFIPAAASGKNFREIFVGSYFNIDSKSAVIKSKEKDNELMKFFFANLEIHDIKAKITDIKSDPIVKGKPKTGKFFLNIVMNGVLKNISMDFIFQDGTITANGLIDISDFNSSLIYELVNQEFDRQHEERVAKMVAISFHTKVKFDLCYSK
ncbi:MAG: YceI family protein [Sulfurimonas sp.]|jgi:hypothetical protein